MNATQILTVAGSTAVRLRPGMTVLLDNDRWKVIAIRTSLGYTTVVFEHADPLAGQRPAQFTRQYRSNHSFTVVASR